MDTNKKKALYDFLMMLAATTVSIVLTFGTTAIVDRKKKKAEKREMVMMIMYDMRETLEKLGRCDQDLNKFFDIHVEVLAHPQQFEESFMPMELYIPTADYTTTTENIFKSNIETIRTIAVVASPRVDNLDGLRFKVGRNVPFDVRCALILLHIRHLSIGPDVLLHVLCSVVIIVETLHYLHFRSERREQ